MHIGCVHTYIHYELCYVTILHFLSAVFFFWLFNCSTILRATLGESFFVFFCWQLCICACVSERASEQYFVCVRGSVCSHCVCAYVFVCVTLCMTHTTNGKKINATAMTAARSVYYAHAERRACVRIHTCTYIGQGLCCCSVEKKKHLSAFGFVSALCTHFVDEWDANGRGRHTARNKNITWYILPTITTRIAVVWKVSEENTLGNTEKFVIRALLHVWNKFLLRFSFSVGVVCGYTEHYN